MSSGLKRHLTNGFKKDIEIENTRNVPDDVVTLTELHDHIESEHLRRLHKERFEATHIRNTFLLEKSLHERLDNIKKQKAKGWKTLALNKAVAAMLREYEETGKY
jgi:hypothetical protein